MAKVTVNKLKFSSKGFSDFGKEVVKGFNDRLEKQTIKFTALTKKRIIQKERAGYKRAGSPLLATGKLSKASRFSNKGAVLKVGYNDTKRSLSAKEKKDIGAENSKKAPRTNAEIAKYHDSGEPRSKMPLRSWVYLNEQQLQRLDFYIKKALGD